MDLENIIQDLTSQISTLQVRVSFLEQEKGDLREENAKMSQENDRLKEQLGLNSSNSSLPPSGNLYWMKRHNHPSSDKRPGAPTWPLLSWLPNKTPDEAPNVFSEACSCGSDLEKEETSLLIVCSLSFSPAGSKIRGFSLNSQTSLLILFKNQLEHIQYNGNDL